MAEFVDLSDVWKMLNELAPGYTAHQSNHYWVVTYRGKVHGNLPTGKKSKKRKDLRLNKVGNLVTTLQLDKARACEFFPALRRLSNFKPANVGPEK